MSEQNQPSIAALQAELEEQRRRYDELWRNYEGCVNGGYDIRWRMKEAGEFLMRWSGLAGSGVIRLIKVDEKVSHEPAVSTEHWLRGEAPPAPPAPELITVSFPVVELGKPEQLLMQWDVRCREDLYLQVRREIEASIKRIVPAESLPAREPLGSTDQSFRGTEPRGPDDSHPRSATAPPLEDVPDRDPPEQDRQSTYPSPP